MCDKEHGCATCCMERALAIACAAWGGCLQWHGAGVCLGLEHLHAGAFAQDSKTAPSRAAVRFARRLTLNVRNRDGVSLLSSVALFYAPAFES